MDTSTGEVKTLPKEEHEALKKKLGRELKPGDKIDEKRVIVSDKVAKMYRKVKNKARSRRKRTEARNRAKAGKP